LSWSWEREEAAEEEKGREEERGRRGRRALVLRRARTVVLAAARKMRGIALSSMVLGCGYIKLFFGGRDGGRG